MRIICHRLDSNETDYELVWLCVTLVALSMATVWFALGLPWPRCVFHELTGLPCVTCGMTRCAIQFFHGHFFAALKWNPLVFTALCGVMAFDLYAFATLTTRAPRLRMVFRQREKKFARGIVIGALALNWIYLLIHWRNF
jgi:uncharacterized protein DUF2752